MEEADYDVGRPEELINHYVRLQAATANMISGVGALALLWSTVVLLGGFVSILGIKEFWILTALSFLMALRIVERCYGEIRRGIYLEEEYICDFIGRQKWMDADMARCQRTILSMALYPKFILIMCLGLLSVNVTPYVSLGISVWRLVQRDHGDAGGDAANTAKLDAALDIFYALVLFQSLLFLYWLALDMMLQTSVFETALLTREQCGGAVWSFKLVHMYFSETTRKFKMDGELPDRWNLITYGVELLRSASGDDDHRWGARVLDKLLRSEFSDDADTSSIRQELLSSRVSIQNLMGMIARRGTAENMENRERGARIVAHLASDLHITLFPGALQCICSMLESTAAACPIPIPSRNQHTDENRTSEHQDDDGAGGGHMAVPIQDQTAGEEQAIRRTVFPSIIKFVKQVMQYSEPRYRHICESLGATPLVYEGSLILEGLTRDNQGNCAEISKDQRLLSMITAPLKSHDFLSKLRDKKIVQIMLVNSIKVLSRLLTSPGDGATRLCRDLASNTEAVGNLIGILEADSEAAQELHEPALDILTEMALDGSLGKPDFNNLFKVLLCIFLEKEANNTTAQELNNVPVREPNNATSQDERETATRLRGKAGEALARLLPSRAARGILSEQDPINLWTTVLDQILSSQMATTQGNRENQSKETKFIAAMLSLTLVMCNENECSKEYFARPTPKDTDLVKKLKEILLEASKRRSVGCLRTVKLTCQVVIAMAKAKPSCIEQFNQHNFKKALTEALETMSEVDIWMLFDGNDREVIKPVRSLAFLVKEAQELLQTA